jgi:DNA-binding transcriptional MocR family regulator
MLEWVPDVARGTQPFYLALADAIEADIAAGRLRPDDRLPTHRELAKRLYVTVGTVTRAYAECIRRGLLSGEVGRGTFVRTEQAPFVPETGAGVLDLSVVHPPSDVDVAPLLATTLTESGLGLVAVGSEEPTDAPHHREAAAHWLSHAGWAPHPDAVVLTAGAQHGITASLAALTEPGDVVATDELTNPGLLAAARLLHLPVIGLGRDADGPLPDALDSACRARPVRALYLQPNLHNPTATTMPPGRREDLALIAAKRGIYVVEDDPFGQLDPGRPAPIAAHLPDRTIHLGGVSKTLALGLRVGFAAAPTTLHARLLTAVRASTWTVAPLLAEIVVRWLADGTADRILAARRKASATRLALATDLLDVRHGPGAAHVWLELPEPWRPTAFVKAAAERGVAVSSGEDYAVGRAAAAFGVRIGIGVGLPELRHGLAELANLLAEEPGAPAVR